jgi:hypothetical protein
VAGGPLCPLAQIMHDDRRKQFSIFMQLCRAHGTLLAWLLGARRSARRAVSGCGGRALV